MNDPIADTARSLLDGHVVLSRALAERGHFPAVDVGQSLSRLMGQVAPKEQQALATRLRRLLAAHRKAEDLIAVGAYAPGHDPVLDEAVARMPAIDGFLRQRFDQSSALADTMAALEAVFR
jgi:flagellum-specific ATP synthase